ncbi:MAG: M50 family metallopeptidase [Candidatus Limivicinus sp.]|jgi:regulator of sigma E protease
MTVLYILLAILLFGILIAVHEFGHFSAAKLCGVKVQEFSIGMGPAIVKKQKGETLYSLRCIPIGGYCAMEGEDGDSEDPRAFTRQSVWKRLIILVAGSFMNFLLGLLIVVIVYISATGFRAPIIVDFMEGCPYESEEGLRQGDRFLKIDGHRIYEVGDVGEFLSRGEGVHDIVVKRDGRRVKLEGFNIVPVEYEGQANKMYGFYFGFEEATFGNRLKYSWNTTMEFGRMVWMGLEQLVSGQVGVKDMAGPVGIVDLMAETGENAASTRDAVLDILYLAAFIAVNLAIMNMLPIPALDGGRVFLLLVTAVIELITKKRLDPKYEGYIHAAGMILLLALMAFVMFNDIVRIVTR